MHQALFSHPIPSSTDSSIFSQILALANVQSHPRTSGSRFPCEGVLVETLDPERTL